MHVSIWWRLPHIVHGSDRHARLLVGLHGWLGALARHGGRRDVCTWGHHSRTAHHVWRHLV